MFKSIRFSRKRTNVYGKHTVTASVLGLDEESHGAKVLESINKNYRSVGKMTDEQYQEVILGLRKQRNDTIDSSEGDKSSGKTAEVEDSDEESETVDAVESDVALKIEDLKDSFFSGKLTKDAFEKSLSQFTKSNLLKFKRPDVGLFGRQFPIFQGYIMQLQVVDEEEKLSIWKRVYCLVFSDRVEIRSSMKKVTESTLDFEENLIVEDVILGSSKKTKVAIRLKCNGTSLVLAPTKEKERYKWLYAFALVMREDDDENNI